MKKFWVKIIGSLFFLGYLPLLPGTLASLLGLFLFFFLKSYIYFFTLIVIGLSFLISPYLKPVFKRNDPSCVVIDELAGMGISLFFLPYQIKIAFFAFLVFRILDILKPYPIDLIQKSESSLAFLLDDLVAGFYANLVVHLVIRLNSLIIS